MAQNFFTRDSYNFISRVSFAVWVNLFSLIVYDTCSFQLYYFHLPVRDEKKKDSLYYYCPNFYEYNIIYVLYYNYNIIMPIKTLYTTIPGHEIDRANKKKIDHYNLLWWPLLEFYSRIFDTIYHWSRVGVTHERGMGRSCAK